MTDIFTPEPTLDDYVGEGKKYSDLTAVAKALAEKDRFIAQLQEENRQREAAIQAAQNTKAFEDRIKALETAQTLSPEPPAAQVAPPATPDVEDIVQKAIAAREAANVRTRNLMEVQNKLINTLGQDYSSKVKQRASELHIDMNRLNELAATSPSAFYAMIGLNSGNQPSGSVAPPVSNVNSAALNINTSGEKGNSYYTNLRKEKPGEYFTARIAAEEYNQLKKLGPEKFYAL
jgi:hypothetical protein